MGFSRRGIMSFSTALIAVGFALYGCNQNPTGSVSQDGLADPVIAASTLSGPANCSRTTVQLTYSQLYNGGSVSVGVVGTNLVVIYTAATGYTLNETHFWIGTNPNLIPLTKTFNTTPGQFPYGHHPLPAGTIADTLKIPLSTIGNPSCGTTLYAAAHAAMSKVVNGVVVQNGTGWGSGTRINSKGDWGMYFPFVVSILPDVTDPGPAVICENGAAAFSVTTTGNPSIQWEVSANGGTSWSNATGPSATSATYSINPADLSLNGNLYRAKVVNSTCMSGLCEVRSAAAALTVIAAPSVTYSSTYGPYTQNTAISPDIIPGTMLNVTSCTITGLPDGLTQTGAGGCSITGTPTVSGTFNIEVVAVGNSPCANAIAKFTITINAPCQPSTVSIAPLTASVTEGGTATFTATLGGGANTGIQWQKKIGNGLWTDIPGATLNIYTTPPLSAIADNGNQYRAVVAGNCGPVESAPAVLTVTVNSSECTVNCSQVCYGSPYVGGKTSTGNGIVPIDQSNWFTYTSLVGGAADANGVTTTTMRINGVDVGLLVITNNGNGTLTVAITFDGSTIFDPDLIENWVIKGYVTAPTSVAPGGPDYIAKANHDGYLTAVGNSLTVVIPNDGYNYLFVHANASQGTVVQCPL